MPFVAFPIISPTGGNDNWYCLIERCDQAPYLNALTLNKVAN